MKTSRYTTRRYPLYISIFIFLTLGTYIAAVLFWPLRAIPPQPSQYQASIPASATTTWPTAYSALGTTNAGLLSTSSDEQVPIASITKLVTALVILDAKPLKQGEVGPTITLTQEDAALYNKYLAIDGTVGPANANMNITEYQLLQGMLMSSANNYADTAALWAYGSMDAYLAAAKSYLTKHRLDKTIVVDATGFSPSSKSTPADLVKLGIIAVEDPIITSITSQKSAVLPGIGTFTNTNRLLGTGGFIGLKTGTTEEAGSCLLFASQFTKNGQPITLVGVVLGSPNHPALFQSVSSLAEQTTAQFNTSAITKAGDVFASYKAPWGATTHAVSPTIESFYWQGISPAITTNLVSVEPGEQSKAGELAVTIGKKTSTSELKLDKPLKKPSPWWRITHPRYIFNI